MNSIEVKKIRTKLGLSQNDFGNMLGVSLRSVQNWESGSRNISKSTQKLLLSKLKDVQSTEQSTYKKEEPTLRTEVNELKVKVATLKENFKMVYDQLLFLQNSWIASKKDNDNSKLG